MRRILSLVAATGTGVIVSGLPPTARSARTARGHKLSRQADR